MRKTIALLFLLIANIAMLAHGIVPHHRHTSLLAAAIHILDYHAHGDAIASEHRTPPYPHQDSTDLRDHHHDGDHHDGDEACRVEESCIASFTLRKDDGLHAADTPAQHADAVLGHPTLSPIPYLSATPWRHRPYTETRRDAVMARAAGLRAPPFC